MDYQPILVLNGFENNKDVMRGQIRESEESMKWSLPAYYLR